MHTHLVLSTNRRFLLGLAVIHDYPEEGAIRLAYHESAMDEKSALAI